MGAGGLAALRRVPLLPVAGWCARGVASAGGGWWRARRGCDELTTIRGGSPALGGWWRVCQFADFSTCRFVGFPTCWEVGGMGRRGHGGVRARRRKGEVKTR